MHMEVRGHASTIGRLHMPVCSRDETQASWLAGTPLLTDTRNTLLS